MQTAISKPEFYKKADDAGLLVPVENIVAAFEGLLGADQRSGECIEVGPKGMRSVREPEFMDQETEDSFKLLIDRARPLHLPGGQAS